MKQSNIKKNAKHKEKRLNENLLHYQPSHVDVFID